MQQQQVVGVGKVYCVPLEHSDQRHQREATWEFNEVELAHVGVESRRGELGSLRLSGFDVVGPLSSLAGSIVLDTLLSVTPPRPRPSTDSPHSFVPPHSFV